MRNKLDLFTSRKERVGWIEVADNGRISSTVSSSLGDVANTLEQIIKDAISNGLTIRQSRVCEGKILEIPELVTPKEEAFILALRDKINRTRFGMQRVFAILCRNMDSCLIEGGAK